MTFKEYKDEIESTFEPCTKLEATSDTTLLNANKTGDRDAYKGISWINYWRAMSGKTSSTMCCSSCGKEIFVGKPTPAQKIRFSVGDDNVDNHRAEGGHIWVNAPKEANNTGGRYITPLCPSCNAKRGQQITIKKGSELYKELGATKKED